MPSKLRADGLRGFESPKEDAHRKVVLGEMSSTGSNMQATHIKHTGSLLVFQGVENFTPTQLLPHHPVFCILLLVFASQKLPKIVHPLYFAEIS